MSAVETGPGVAPGPPPVGTARRRAVTRLAVAALLCVLVLVVLTLVFVRTHAGQRLDDAALSGRVVQHGRSAERSDELLRTISVGSLAVFGLSLMAIALVRGRWHLALGVGAVIVGSNVTTQAYKAVIVRPDLLHNGIIPFNTLPSGHSTVAASLAAALILVVPYRLRPLAATFGGLYAGGIAAMTLAAGWHRPSDAVTAFAVVGIWTFGVAALLVAGRGPGAPRAPEGLPGLLVGAIVVLGIGFAVILATTTINRAAGIHLVKIGLAYIVAAGSIVAVAVTFVVIEVLLLRGVSLDAPFRRRRVTPRP